jgi:Ser/Thr protein kinase RdoA (MazF antagonist)
MEITRVADFYQLSGGQQATLLEGLARSALVHWEMDDNAEIRLIKHRENAVFEVKDGDRHLALRIHRANYHSDLELESELQWIEAINSPELKTPQVIRTANGDLFVRVKGTGIPEARQVDALEFVKGEPMGSVEEGLADISQVVPTFTSMGRLMAISHNRAEQWTLPKTFTRHAWDSEGLLGDNPFWGRFWELPHLTDEQRVRLNEVRIRAKQDLAEYGKTADRYSLIHADFVPENLLMTDAGVCLIDFDDSGFGWHLFDIVTSFFFHLGQDYFDEASSAFFNGYSEIRELPYRCEELLPLFYLLRGTTYLGWMHTRPEIATANEMAPLIITAVDEMVEEYL